MSEFCGAAHSLPGAVLCNPWSIDEVAETLHRAMALSKMERAKVKQTVILSFLAKHN